MYVPINRTARTDVNVVEILIESQDKEVRLNANDFLEACMTEKLDEHIGAACAVSDISGLPAIKVHTCELSLNLTAQELLRLGRRELEREEFVKLRDRYGIFYEIHDDFYADDGESLQPMSDR